MDLAIKIHKCLSNGCGSHELLNVINNIVDKNMLVKVNEYFIQKYHATPHELIGEKFETEEVFAISSTLKYIREPNQENRRARNTFYDKIGYSLPAKAQ